jgi:hypothetical protein
MDIESGLNAIISSVVQSRARPVLQLDDREAHCILIANAFMRRSGVISGAERQLWFGRLSGAGVRTEGDLRSWVRLESPPWETALPGDHRSWVREARLWEACRKDADKLLEMGVKVFRWSAPADFPFAGGGGGGPPGGKAVSPLPAAPCPAVLFGKGGLDFDLPLFAVFNSRKPRFVSPDSDWLRALRFFFGSLDLRGLALAASAGTLTHDLAGTQASRSGLHLNLVAPFALMKADGELSGTYGKGARSMPVVSCMLDAVSCSRGKAPLCRDRILGVLANLHLVLEIRSSGNLSAVLEEIQAKSPRPQLIFEPGEKNPSNAGNYSLLEKFPEYSHRFRLPRSIDSPAAHRVERNRSPRCEDIAWNDYLFHYTRGCAGAWPGESGRQYLVDLFDGHPLSGHFALDTLIRILQEDLIRAGSRLVRGGTAVICWSSHPPQELFAMRKWNRALVRWTVEACGVAVRRDILRSLGAKPAIYGSEPVYSRLAESERYRFQLSCPPKSASWRHEREWRVLGDLALGKLKPDDGFVFVQTEEEKAKLCSHVNPGLSIVALNA